MVGTNLPNAGLQPSLIDEQSESSKPALGSRRHYHYTSMDTAMRYILRDRELRLSPFRHMNDPLEARDWEITLPVRVDPDQPAPLGRVDQDRLRRMANQMLKDNCKVLCLTDERDGTDGYAHASMWAHYADNHAGVSLAFDPAILEEKVALATQHVGKLYSGQVSYCAPREAAFALSIPRTELASVSRQADEHLENIVAQAVSAHLVTYHEDLFLRKQLEWAPECEHRHVLYTNNSLPQKIGFGEALRAVVIGWRFQDVYLPSLRALTNEVPIFQLDWGLGRPQLRGVSGGS